MKNIALLCFLLLASACVFVARADEETPVVDAPKMEDQPETADVMADEEQTEEDEKVDAESDEEETEADDAQQEEEDQEDEEETTDIADDEPEKRGLPCRRYRKGKLWCKACGCRRVCKFKYCTRRVCKPKKCSRKVCRSVTKYRLVRYKSRNPRYPAYGSRYLWKTKRVPFKVRVCKRVSVFCKPKCYNHRYQCGRTCGSICKRKCRSYYW